MATDAEAIAAGFTLPQGSDMISDGDNAITTNAKVALDLINAAEFARTSLGTAIDLDTVWSPGLHPIVNSAVDWVAQHYPENATGSLLVQPTTTSSGTQMFIGGQVANPSVWVRYKASNVIGVWEKISGWAKGAVAKYPMPLAVDRNIDAWLSSSRNGEYDITNPSAITSAGGTSPSPFGYKLFHFTNSTNNQHIQRAVITHYAAHVEVQRVYNTATLAWSPWERMATETYVQAQMAGTATYRHELLTEDLRTTHGGVFGTAGASPVALTFDDYPRDFRDKVKPLLEARGIPATLALSSQMYDPANTLLEPGATGTTWTEIDGWPYEVANHGRTHGNALSDVDRIAEIVTGKAELQANLPSHPIRCFIQPSANYGTGFNNGNSLESYAGTHAGKLILDQHVMITGTRTFNGRYSVPRRGNPITGITRAWIDSSTVDTQNRINTAVANNEGIIIGAHAERFDTEGMTTIAQLTAFLDWLISEQTAGRIKLVTLSEWAVADIGSV